MKKFFCVLLCTAYLAVAACCGYYSYEIYAAPLPRDFTTYAPLERKVFDLSYDEIKEIRFFGQRKQYEKGFEIVFDAEKTPSELKEWIDFLNSYRYLTARPSWDFRGDFLGSWEKFCGVKITKWSGEEFGFRALDGYLRMGQLDMSRDEYFRNPWNRWRMGTICYYGDTSRIFEAVYG